MSYEQKMPDADALRASLERAFLANLPKILDDAVTNLLGLFPQPEEPPLQEPPMPLLNGGANRNLPEEPPEQPDEPLQEPKPKPAPKPKQKAKQKPKVSKGKKTQLEKIVEKLATNETARKPASDPYYNLSTNKISNGASQRMRNSYHFYENADKSIRVCHSKKGKDFSELIGTLGVEVTDFPPKPAPKKQKAEPEPEPEAPTIPPAAVKVTVNPITLRHQDDYGFIHNMEARLVVGKIDSNRTTDPLAVAPLAAKDIGFCASKGWIVATEDEVEEYVGALRARLDAEADTADSVTAALAVHFVEEEDVSDIIMDDISEDDFRQMYRARRKTPNVSDIADKTDLAENVVTFMIDNIDKLKKRWPQQPIRTRNKSKTTA